MQRSFTNFYNTESNIVLLRGNGNRMGFAPAARLILKAGFMYASNKPLWW